MRRIIVVLFCATLMMSVFGAIIPTNTSAYTTHAPIYIDGNGNFASANGVSNPGATGDETDPYIIENWEIDASSANGIDIRNTDAYFIIRNCFVRDGKYSYHGIYFYKVQNGRVENTLISNNRNAISLYDSSSNIIYNNSANSNNYDCIYLEYSNNNNICNNDVLSNSNSNGIYLYYSSNNNIFNNNANSNSNGIYLSYSSNNNIYNNNASYNGCGIVLGYYSSNNNIFNNNFLSNTYGISLGASSNNIYNNIANLNNLDGIYLSGSSSNNIYNNNANSNKRYGIYLYSSSDNNIHNNIANSNDYYGIYLYSSSDNNIHNNIANSNDYYGIYLYSSSDNNILFNNSANSNNRYGIYLYDDSCSNNIFNNSASNNNHGIYLSGSSSNNIYSNSASNNGYGIYLSGSNNNIHNNIANSNYYYGIYLSGSNDNIYNNSASNNRYGIYLQYSSYNHIHNNSANSNNEYGIYLYSSSDNNILFNNSANSNYYYGIRLESSSYNTFVSNNISWNYHSVEIYDSNCENNIFHHNNFINGSVVNIIDNGANTKWDDGDGEGNHWSNYIGLDNGFNGRVAGDGVGDTKIPHMGLDNYPLMESVEQPYAPETTPPLISFVIVSGITENSAIITWTTDENSDSRVNYSINSDLSSNSTKYDSTMIATHSITITGLSPSTTYYFEVSSTDTYGNTATDTNNSNYYRFTASEEDTIPPVISSVSASDITANSATITWTTDENSDSRVNYSINPNLSSNSTKYDSIMTTGHSITLTGLSPGTTYYFEVSSADGSGNTATDANNSNYYRFTTLDVMPPIISSVSVSDITASSATITWTTDENSDSRVNYSINSDLSSNSTKYDSIMTTSHSITLTGLSPGATYYFEVSSADSSGNTATETNNSNYYKFTTSEEDTTPPVISSVSISDITASSATIAWTTDENSDSRANYSINSDLSSNSTKYDSIMTTSHSITLTGLSPGATYYFEVSSADSSGNTATDDNSTHYYTFTTEKPTTEEPGFSILDYWWVILLVVIVIIVVVVAMSRRKKGKELEQPPGSEGTTEEVPPPSSEIQ